MDKRRTPRRQKHVILLRDLAARREVVGGAAKLLFGERREPAEARPGPNVPAPKKS